jgi:hypothetical protein
VSKSRTHSRGGESELSLVWFRWGGGARPGFTHVFTCGLSWVESDRWRVLNSQQAVVDDFGNLVPVP